VLLLGCVALYLLLGDPKILARFSTTFADAESRDRAAAGRLEYWQAGLAMLADYPLGAGGGSFKFDLGRYYAREVSGREEDRSLHNGYLTEATDWGLQGLFLKLMFIGAALVAAFRTSARCRLDGRLDAALIGVCLIASASGFLIHTVFGAFLANEWAYWIVALLVRYSELYRVQEPAAVTVASPATAFGREPLGTPA
jgi:O-antigen ligase